MLVSHSLCGWRAIFIIHGATKGVHAQEYKNAAVYSLFVDRLAGERRCVWFWLAGLGAHRLGRLRIVHAGVWGGWSSLCAAQGAGKRGFFEHRGRAGIEMGCWFALPIQLLFIGCLWLLWAQVSRLF